MPARIDTSRLIAAGIAASIEHFDELPSTQDWARQRAADAECPLPLLVIADRQSAGRGRQGNSWWTGEGSLAFSLLFDPGATNGSRRIEPRLALAVGVAIVDSVAPRIPSQPVGLHWPNDIYAGAGKLAGILVEVLPDGRHILGVGLNSNSLTADAPAELRGQIATLRDLTGRPHDHTQLLIDVLKGIAIRLRQLVAEDSAILDAFDAMCRQHGQTLTLYVGDRAVTGRCAGIGPDGALLLDTPNGRERFLAGTLRPPSRQAKSATEPR